MSDVRGLLRRGVCLCALACASLPVTCALAAARAVGGDDAGVAVSAQNSLVVRLRSFVVGAAGRVVVEPTAGGGRVRLQASRVPAPGSIAPGARSFVVWATGGQVRRLGELRRDARGNASFEFAHPAEFDRYSLVVTAEADAAAARPAGTPVFSTRAGEVSALYPLRPPPPAGDATRARTVSAPPRETVATRRSGATPRPPSSPARPASPRTPAAEFYESINEAVADPARARTLTLVGQRGARRARGYARVATRGGTAYVRVRFRRVPAPSRFGVRKYVMWAVTPDDNQHFLRALPATRLNRRPTYARRPDFAAEEFRLLVTAEPTYPRPRPRGRRVMKTKE